MTEIEITSVTKTVRLYGRSNYLAPMRGAFSFSVNGTEFMNLKVNEDNAGSSGAAQRLISVECPLPAWSFDQVITIPTPFRFRVGNRTFEFFPSRAITEIRAKGPFRHEGKASGEAATAHGTIRVYQSETIGGRFFYLEGDSVALRQFAEQVLQDGRSTLLVRTSPDSPSRDARITPD